MTEVKYTMTRRKTSCREINGFNNFLYFQDMRRKSSKMIQIVCFILALTCLGTVFFLQGFDKGPND